MYPVSEGFLAALRAPTMKVVSRVTASTGDVLSIDDGFVTMDATRAIQRTATLALGASDSLTTKEVYDLIMTPDVELTIQRGLAFDGITELVPLGVFSTDSATFDPRLSSTVTWSGADRSKKVARARFVSPYSIAGGNPLALAGSTLIRSRLPIAEVDFGSVSETIGASVLYDAGPDSDPWKEARALFSDYGYDLHFNGLGICVATAVDDPTLDAAVFSFGAGETNLITDATVDGNLEKTYNGVLVTGEGTELVEPVQALVWDDDPESPTYYLSGFGQRPYFYTSSLLTTVAQCTTAARKILATKRGAAQQVGWASIVNPALEPLDVVEATLAGRSSRMVIDKLTIPLRAKSAASATARETVVTPYG